jgi:flagellar motor switch protein FliN
MTEEPFDDTWIAALQEQELTGRSVRGSAGSCDLADDHADPRAGTGNLDFLLDIPLEVTVMLGRSSMVINKLLQLTHGSVIELDQVAGETVEIYINDKLLGRGEVIVVNDRFGVRITEIISQADRIKNMG